MDETASAWWGAVDGLPGVYRRLRPVVLYGVPAVELIRQEDGPGTLAYCDPPYLPGTRAAPDVYGCEMTEAGHRELLETLLACRGKVIVSGYPSGLYDTELAGWSRYTLDVANHAAGGRRKRRKAKTLWCNY
jgi:DNA adenine methylase